MKFLFILVTFFSLLSYSQNTEINELFLDVPLNESRDSIYDLLTKSNHFSKVTYSDNFPKVFSGKYIKSNSEFTIKHSDSINVQLTFGSVSVQGEKESKNQLYFISYYYISDSKSANRIIKRLKKQINNFTEEKPYYCKNYWKDENEDIERYIGFSNHWFFKNKENIAIELKYEIIKSDENYLIELQYSRYE